MPNPFKNIIDLLSNKTRATNPDFDTKLGNYYNSQLAILQTQSNEEKQITSMTTDELQQKIRDLKTEILSLRQKIAEYKSEGKPTDALQSQIGIKNNEITKCNELIAEKNKTKSKQKGSKTSKNESLEQKALSVAVRQYLDDQYSFTSSKDFLNLNKKLIDEHCSQLAKIVLDEKMIVSSDTMLYENKKVANEIQKYLGPHLKSELNQLIENQKDLIQFYENAKSDINKFESKKGVKLTEKDKEEILKDLDKKISDAKKELKTMVKTPDSYVEEYIGRLLKNEFFSNTVLNESLIQGRITQGMPSLPQAPQSPPQRFDDVEAKMKKRIDEGDFPKLPEPPKMLHFQHGYSSSKKEPEQQVVEVKRKNTIS